MAWFQKPKSGKPVAAPLCSQCGERPGVIHLTRAQSGDAAGRELWLCERCAKVRRNNPRES